MQGLIVALSWVYDTATDRESMSFSSNDHSRTDRRSDPGCGWYYQGVEVIVLLWFASIVGYYYWSMGFLRLALQILGIGS